jgi:hypothetical protein
MSRVARYAAGVTLLVAICGGGGCSSFFQETVNLAPSSGQILEYYPRQVKGYQNSYPPRRMLVLPSTDAREFNDPSASDHAPDDQGNPRIGVVLDRDHHVIQRIYSQPLGPVVQKAFAASAEEAGLVPSVSDDSVDSALKERTFEYVLASTLVRCWVKKQRGSDTRYGPTWRTAADFAVEVRIYKPPFHNPFWQGTIAATYDDPPVGNFTIGADDDTSVYDEPGQVLSVALTRAVAGVFRRGDLRSLILEDIITR